LRKLSKPLLNQILKRSLRVCFLTTWSTVTGCSLEGVPWWAEILRERRRTGDYGEGHSVGSEQRERHGQASAENRYLLTPYRNVTGKTPLRW